jgi:hypothetical protein
VWFSYVYTHKTVGPAVTQRVKLAEAKLGITAHLTNHIFHNGYLPARYRTVVTWQGPCGRKIEEHERLEDLLTAGEGHCETSPLRLIIGKSAVIARLARVPLTFSIIDATCTHTRTCHSVCH